MRDQSWESGFPAEIAGKILSWRHTGFNIHIKVRATTK
jgi:hypothetical protein